MEPLSDDDLLHICEKLETKDLEIFMKTSKRIEVICSYEWNKRHRLRFRPGHRFLSDERRNQLKECIKTGLLEKEWILSELGRLSDDYPENFDPELLRLIKEKSKEMFEELHTTVFPIYSEEVAIETGIEWNEAEETRQINKVGRKYLNQVINSIHSDRSLINLLSEINRFLGSERMEMIAC